MIKTRTLKFGLSALHRTGIAGALAPHMQGLGAILMMHHVRPQQQRAFCPNGLLEITPEFLDDTCREVRRAGFDIVAIDEAHARLTGQERGRRPFACFTFDDGYRDNRDYAFPILKRHGVPLTVYVASDFADGQGFMWWLVLEQVIRNAKSLTAVIDGRHQRFACESDSEKANTWSALYWTLRNTCETEARQTVAALAAAAGIDPLATCRELAMTWPEVAEFACDPLVTIGAHSMSHFALGRLEADQARAEMKGSVKRIEHELGQPCRHFCYPYGDPGSACEREFQTAENLGFATAVTTRKGFITAAHANATTALPRVSINGNFQSISCLRALLSGVPFALWNSFAPLLGRQAPQQTVTATRSDPGRRASHRPRLSTASSAGANGAGSMKLVRSTPYS